MADVTDQQPPTATDRMADTVELCAQICEERADELPFGQARSELLSIARDLREGKLPSGIKQCASCGVWTKEHPADWTIKDWNYCHNCDTRKL